MKTARDFFELVVCETVEEFRQHPDNVRRGFLASIVLHHLADYWTSETGGKQEDLELKCSDFALVRDVSNAAKHMTLSRNTYRIKQSKQINATPHEGLLNASFGDGHFAEPSEVWIKLDNGTNERLMPIVDAVTNMWRGIYP